MMTNTMTHAPFNGVIGSDSPNPTPKRTVQNNQCQIADDAQKTKHEILRRKRMRLRRRISKQIRNLKISAFGGEFRISYFGAGALEAQ